MIPNTDGDATPLGAEAALSVLPVVYRIWASARMGQHDGWFRSWVPDSVFSAGEWSRFGGGLEASSLDIEEVLAGAADFHVHLFDMLRSLSLLLRLLG